jgi:Tfp pilus assembly protein PilF
VSRIHEALSRGRRPSTQRPPERLAQTDTVLATLGFPAERKAEPPRRLGLAILLVALFATAGYALWAIAIPALTGPRATESPVHLASARPSSNRPGPSPSPSTSPSASATATVSASPAAAPRANPNPHAKPNAERESNSRSAEPQSPRPISLATSPSSARPPDDFQLALYYQRAGEFDRALFHYNAILQHDELNVEAHNNLGLLYRDKGLLDDAVREFQRALIIDPRYARAHVNLGVAWLQQGHPDRAAAEFRQALALQPRDVDAMVNLALAEKANGQLADARDSLIKALALDPRNAAAHYNLAIQDEEAGDASRAIDHYRAFLQYAGPDQAARAPEVRARIDALRVKLR